MEQLASFVNQYDTILLDMDGVITSEAVYWDAAALTVWELLNSHRYFGTENIDPVALSAQANTLRREIFCDDAIIKTVKNRGINNNWDLAWLVASGALILNTRNFNAVHNWLSSLPDTATELCVAVSEGLQNQCRMPEEKAMHARGFWLTVQLCFQEWFLGSEMFPKYWNAPCVQSEKPGLTFGEEPIVNKQKLLALFAAITQNKKLGIGTGRPYIEAITPLKNWGALPYVHPDAIITYQDVCDAQNEFQKTRPNIILTKPHPYVFLRGIFGRLVDDDSLIDGHYDRAQCRKTLVVGDALCDLLAAKTAGCDFAAVLTGIDGEKARDVFKAEKADYILHNILELLEA